MKTLRIYSATLKDCDKEMIVQPFISTDDDSAVQTVRNAIREDKNILAMALAERVKLYWICDINTDDFSVVNDSNSMFSLFSESYFRKYAQLVYAENQKMEANAAEAEVMSDPETKEAFYHDQCESTHIPSDEFMKGEV